MKPLSTKNQQLTAPTTRNLLILRSRNSISDRLLVCDLESSRLFSISTAAPKTRAPTVQRSVAGQVTDPFNPAPPVAQLVRDRTSGQLPAPR